MAPRPDLILRQLDRLPTLPAVAVRVLELAADDAADARRIGEVVRDDPALSARILQLLSAADRGVGQRVTDVPQAVALLGLEQVRVAVLAVSVFDTLNAPAAGDIKAAAAPDALSPVARRDAFWEHCLAVACCAEALAPVCGVRPAEAFLAGLLHDLGKIALDAALPKSFQRVVEAAELLRGDIADVEREVVGMDHQLVGKRLAERWGLPAAVRDACWLHGTPALPGAAVALEDQTAHAKLVRLVSLADRLARERHLGYSGNHDLSADRGLMTAALGVTDAQVDAAIASLMTTLGPRAAALGLGDGPPGEVFRKALERANRELGRVGGQLAAKNKRLEVRARFFDATAAFHADLRPDGEVAEVLAAVAANACRVLGVASAAAFVEDEAVAADADGLVLAGPALRPPGDDADVFPVRGEGPVQAAVPELAWATDALAPHLGGPKLWWLRLVCEGQPVGGVAWAGPDGEARRLASCFDQLAVVAGAWALAVRTAQVRRAGREATEKLADTARQLQAAQEQALRARTLVALSQVAAGAAHEMNNPLQIISGRSQLLFQQLKPRDPNAAAKAKLIFEQSQQLGEMIGQLMEFAKPPRGRIEPTDVAGLIEAAFRQTGERAEPGVWQSRTVRPRVPEGLPRVVVDAEQVGGAVAEVLLNALQHTAAGGIIGLDANHDATTGRIVLCVSDDGTGMSEEVARHACEPFFSAKPAGRRRGMGLARALRRVDASGGWLRIESTPGAGTRVYVLLPAEPPVAAAA